MTVNKKAGNTAFFSILMLTVCFAAVTAGTLFYRSLQPDVETLNETDVYWQDEEWKVVNFFAPWCAPCLREIPALNQLHSVSEKTYRILGVAYDGGTKAELLTLTSQLKIEFDVIDTSDPVELPMVYPDYLPATYLVSPQGKVVKTLYGEQTEQSIIDNLQAIM